MLRPIRHIALIMALTATPTMADDFSLRSAVGGGLGGALGGLLGAELGGRSAAVLGSGLGAAAGSAVATVGYPRQDDRYRSRNCSYEQWKIDRCRRYYD